MSRIVDYFCFSSKITSMEITIAILVFLIFYTINMFYITVLYHRTLTHKALDLTSLGLFLVKHTALWVTGIDPKIWVCMHRLHHKHSDTALDPHSPLNSNIPMVMWRQIRYYDLLGDKLIKKDSKYTDIVADLPFDIHYLNKHKLWLVPYLFQILITYLAYLYSDSFLISTAYFLGIISHPVQGWLINSFGHKVGYVSYDTKDNSKNNSFLAYTVFGEGYQNNHHAFPKSSNFALNKGELDLGFALCKLGKKIKIVKEIQ